jgi:transposase
VIWLLRKLRPDFKTIADFRRENAAGIKAVARQFLLLCRKLELFGGELVAIDSTKIKGQNAKGRNYNAAKVAALLAAVDEKVSAYLAELEASDAAEARPDPGGGERLSAAQLKEKIAQLKERRGELESVAGELWRRAARRRSHRATRTRAP